MTSWPVLQVCARFLPESNAACFYLAEGTALVPRDRFQRAEMLRWMCFEQCDHELNVATLRFWLSFLGVERLSDIQRARLPVKRAAGEAALALMQEHLNDRAFFVRERLSLADIALYAYTHVAEGGGSRLADYPAVQAWLGRVETSPGYIPLAD